MDIAFCTTTCRGRWPASCARFRARALTRMRRWTRSSLMRESHCIHSGRAASTCASGVPGQCVVDVGCIAIRRGHRAAHLEGGGAERQELDEQPAADVSLCDSLPIRDELLLCTRSVDRHVAKEEVRDEVAPAKHV
eukprot:2810827-Prymnesium_polylepis.1